MGDLKIGILGEMNRNSANDSEREAFPASRHRAGIPIDIDVGQLSARLVPGLSPPISHSRSFDHRRLARLPLTAIASAFRCPTSTTRRLPRVTPV